MANVKAKTPVKTVAHVKAKTPVKTVAPVKAKTPVKTKVRKFPMAIGQCADLLYELKAQRAAAQKIVDAIDDDYTALKTHIIKNLPKSKASGVAGKIARVTIISKTCPMVKDWAIFWKHVVTTKGYDLVQRRVSDAAVAARWDDGKVVPGIEKFNITTVSLNKV